MPVRCGGQNSVTASDFVESSRENSNIQRALEPPAEGAIIRGIAGVPTVGSPNPLLRRRKREGEVELIASLLPTVANLPTHTGKFDDHGHLRYLSYSLRRQPVFVPRYRLYRPILRMRLILRALGQLIEDPGNRSAL